MEITVQATFLIIKQLLEDNKHLEVLIEVDGLEFRNPLELAEAYIYRTEAMLALGDFTSSYLEEALNILSPTGEMKLFAFAKYLRARQLAVCDKHIDAHEQLLESFVSYKRIGDIRGMGRTTNMMSILAYQQGDFTNFFTYANRSYDFYQQTSLRSQAGMVISNMCSARVRIGDFAGAQESLGVVYRDFLPLFEDNHKYNYYHISALMYSQLGDFERARKNLDVASRLRKDLKREVFRQHELSGYLYCLAGNYKAAEKALDSGLKIAMETAPESSLVSQIKRLYGDLYLVTNQYEKCQQFTDEALVVAEKIGERVEIAACYRIFAQLDQIHNHDDKAREWYQKAIDLFAQIGSQWELAITRHLAGASGLYYNGERMAMLAMARDYFASENIENKVSEVDALLRQARPKRKLTLTSTTNCPTVIAKSKVMKDILTLAGDVAQSEMNVLLLGETGTGKDLLARYIHHQSGLKGEFVSLNSAAVPNSMIESELFGHKKGSFTGADEDRVGLLERANGGTFYLNEIADASPEFQAKLLEVLETRSVRRLGENKKRKLTFRLIAATNYNLREHARAGDFRVDLFHRLNEVPITLPLLAERTEDIPALVKHFLHESNSALKITESQLQQLGEILSCYDYSGNVRQLQALVTRLAMLARDDAVELIIQAQSCNGLSDSEFLGRILSRSNWNRTHVARTLGVSEGTVRRRIAKYRIFANQ